MTGKAGGEFFVKHVFRRMSYVILNPADNVCRIEAKPQNLKGDDGYDTFSIRIKRSLTVKLDETADASGRSRNYVISRILEDGVENTVIVEAEQP